ncbi:MAG: phosphoribosyltransferase family protein [Nanoarchaeota archaeon]
MFKNRLESGYLLANELKKLKEKNKGLFNNSLIVAIPRGGVEVAFPICKELNIPIKLLISKKISHPEDEEFAIGSFVDEKHFIIENLNEMKLFNIANLIQKTKEKVETYKNRYKDFILKKEEIKEKTIILVDDGMATGNTILLALKYLKENHAKFIILAVPCAHEEAILKVHNLVDYLIVLFVSNSSFFAISMCFEDFHQLSDKEVLKYLKTCQE